MEWIKKWTVPGSKAGVEWTVAVDKNGSWGCSCPVWKYRREECKHIRQIKDDPPQEVEIAKPRYVLAAVDRPTLKDNDLLIPLVKIGDTHMEATIVYSMLSHGYTMHEIRQIRAHVPKGWSAKAVIDYINFHGEADYGEVRVWSGNADG